jgi:hypothetical protein
VSVLLILFWLFGFAILGVGSGSTNSSSSGSARIGPPAKCSQQSGAETNKQRCRGVARQP